MWEAYFAALGGDIRAAGRRYTPRGNGVFSRRHALAGAGNIHRRGAGGGAGGVSLRAGGGGVSGSQSRHADDGKIARLPGNGREPAVHRRAEFRRALAEGHWPHPHAGGGVEAVRMAKAAGFANISIDLMYGLPGQTMDAWEATLKTALSLPLAHISAYALIVEEGTPMAAREDELPGEEMVLSMQRLCTRALAARGLRAMKFPTTPARLCLPPQPRLLAAGEYLGFGCAAHSFFRRRALPQRLQSGRLPARCAGIGVRARGRRGSARGDGHARNAHARRAVAGKLAARIWRGFLRRARKVLDKLRRAGLLDVADGHVYLTEKGMEVHNAVVLALL